MTGSAVMSSQVTVRAHGVDVTDGCSYTPHLCQLRQECVRADLIKAHTLHWRRIFIRHAPEQCTEKVNDTEKAHYPH